MTQQAAIQTYKDLIVWQKAFELCLRIYRATRSFPAEERFGLSAELRKTARSVMYNIAEGHRRNSTADYIRFLDISSGSTAELETQLMLAAELGYFTADDASSIPALHGEIERMLAALIRSLRKKNTR